MISYSGIIYSEDAGLPTLHDIAVALFRTSRWNGSTKIFWPVGMHSHVVADLLSPYGHRMELAGLCHDLAEGCGLGDIASPLKNEGNRSTERKILERIWKDLLGIDLASEHDDQRLHDADQLAAAVERAIFLDGVRKYDNTIETLKALSFTRQRMRIYQSCRNYLDPNGAPVYGFIHRVNALVKVIDADANLHAVPGAALGTMRPPVAGTTTGTGAVPVRCPDRPLAPARSVASRVRGLHADDGCLLCCGMCGAAYSSLYKHSCHPDSGPVAEGGTASC